MSTNLGGEMITFGKCLLKFKFMLFKVQICADLTCGLDDKCIGKLELNVDRIISLYPMYKEVNLPIYTAVKYYRYYMSAFSNIINSLSTLL